MAQASAPHSTTTSTSTGLQVRVDHRHAVPGPLSPPQPRRWQEALPTPQTHAAAALLATQPVGTTVTINRPSGVVAAYRMV